MPRDAVPPEQRETVASRAREIAGRIKILSKTVHESFAGSRPLAERVAILTRVTTEIEVAAIPFISWMERRTHPETADLMKRRIQLALDEALACVGYDIPEYATGTPTRVNQDPSAGAARNARLAVIGMMTAAMIVDWAKDIEADGKQASEGQDEYVPAAEIEKLYGVKAPWLSKRAHVAGIRREATPEDRQRWSDYRLIWVWNKRLVFEMTEGKARN